MLASKIVQIAIDRPYPAVYDFLADPMNFTRWASIPESTMEPLDGGDWLVDLPAGRLAIRFSPRNTFGVLDYQTFPPEENGGPVTPVRLVPNGRGCLLLLVWFQRPGISDAQFASDAEWVASDLQRLKALLEAG